MIRVIVADDHEIFREGLIRMFAHHPSQLEVVGDAGNGDRALELILREKPDVAVLDISMPGIDSFQLMERLQQSGHRETKVIILTMHNNPSLASRAMKLGAAGYVLKDNAFKDLVYAIETVMKGNKFVSGAVSEKLLVGNSSESQERLLLLTGREREILHYIALGRKNRDIAGELCISVKTVDSHRTRIMEKLGLHSVADLVRFAVKAGLL